MHCKKCGRCCGIIRIYITHPLSESELSVFIFKGGRAVNDYLEFDKPCKFLKTDGTCSIYEYRPQYCKDFYCEEAKENKHD